MTTSSRWNNKHVLDANLVARRAHCSTVPNRPLRHKLVMACQGCIKVLHQRWTGKATDWLLRLHPLKQECSPQKTLIGKPHAHSVLPLACGLRFGLEVACWWLWGLVCSFPGEMKHLPRLASLTTTRGGGAVNKCDENRRCVKTRVTTVIRLRCGVVDLSRETAFHNVDNIVHKECDIGISRKYHLCTTDPVLDHQIT